MKELLTHAIKKVTLELIYEVVDERTSKILERLEKIERRQEEDFRYLNDKIDTQFGQLNQKIDSQITQLNQKIDSQTGQLNHRIDTVIQLLVGIKQPDK